MQQQVAEASTIEAPKIPTLSQLAEYIRARDHAGEEITRIREETESLINDLTLDLQNQIREVREREEAKVAEDLQALYESRTIADRLYREGVRACVAANVMDEGRYQIVNKARVDHPINIARFRASFPDVFERAVSVKKTDAVNALMTALGIKKAAAESRLEKVCDDVPAGEPVWELTVKAEPKDARREMR